MQCEPGLTVISDYEKSLTSALHSAFPDSRLQGCYFHFCQAVYRRIQKLGLACTFSGNANFREVVRILMALAFLPSEEVLSSLIQIEQTFRGIDVAVDALFEYFRRNWLSDIKLWNVHGQCVRTNNEL